MSAPLTHAQEAQKLTADALVDLFQITLKNGVIFRFKNENTVVWQGVTYEGLACKMTGGARTSDSEENRATLQVMNPVGVFNTAAMNGDIDLAIVTKKEVLRTHLEANTNIYNQRMWYVGRIPELISGQFITLDLRNMTEGPNFQIPVRMYTPDVFPTVSL